MNLLNRFSFNVYAWYGCYMEKDKINCYGPYNNYTNTCMMLQHKMGDSFNIIPWSINSTCLFMPEFIRQIKITNKLKPYNPVVVFNN
jgi:hypothetical protein